MFENYRYIRLSKVKVDVRGEWGVGVGGGGRSIKYGDTDVAGSRVVYFR